MVALLLATMFSQGRHLAPFIVGPMDIVCTLMCTRRSARGERHLKTSL